MDIRSIINRITQFVVRYQWAITAGLFVCVVMQQCTINAMQHQLDSYRKAYTLPLGNADAPDADGALSLLPDKNDVEQALPQPSAGGAEQSSGSVWPIVVSVLIVLVAILLIAYRKGWFPFRSMIRGQLWQDLHGRVVYTLTVANHKGKSLTVSEPMIEFIKRGSTRKFRMPVSDFPLTLLPGTQHSVNVSLQRLMEQNISLTEYKIIRVSVQCNGKRCKTMPLAVRWKR